MVLISTGHLPITSPHCYCYSKVYGIILAGMILRALNSCHHRK